MKAIRIVALGLLALVIIASFACTNSSNPPEPTVSPTVLGANASPESPTPATSCPSPTPCPDCPESTPCPEETPCPACPEPITCPTCPEPIVCPEAPACPPPTVCPDCPKPSEENCRWLYPCPGCLCVDDLTCPGLLAECDAAYKDCVGGFAECTALLVTCNTAPGQVIDQQDLDEVCRLIDDLVGDSQDLDSAWGVLKTKLMMDQDYGVLDWRPTDSAVSDVGWTVSWLRSWATGNCW